MRAVALLDATVGALTAVRADLLSRIVPAETDTLATADVAEVASEDQGIIELTPYKEAAEVADKILKVSLKTINKWCGEGLFPGAKNLGKAGWRIPPKAIIEFELPSRRAAKPRRAA